MCVIIHTKRKDLLKEKELREAMRSNPAGFFLAALYREDGKPKRDILRTMDEKAAEGFWREQPDDREMVMHFRIPSRGMDRTVDNVHGWEEDGILFSHNMTIRSVDGMMGRIKWKGTDSEFFFRKIFIPMYRGFGKDAYCAGRFCDDLDNIVRFFCGTDNRFCFVMPDNVVLRYGDWAGDDPARKVGDEPGFFASNASYRVFERAWPERGGYGAGEASGFRSYGTVSKVGEKVQGQKEEEDGMAHDRRPAVGPELLPSASVAYGCDDECAGGVAVHELGPAVVLRLALADLVIANYMALVRQMKLRSPAEIAVLETLRPKWFTEKTTKAAAEAVRCFEVMSTDGTADAISTYAAELESQLGKFFAGAMYPPQKIEIDNIRKHYGELVKEISAFCGIAFVDLNWKATDAEDFLHIYTLEHSKRRNRPYIDEICADDIFVPDDMKSEDALNSASNMLKVIKLLAEGCDVNDIDGFVALS